MMKINHASIASVVGVGLLATFTVLLVKRSIGELTYAALVGASLLVAIAISVLPRVIEMNLKEGKLLLAKLEAAKAEIASMYGGIEYIKRNGIDFQKDKIVGNSLTSTGSIRNYVSGCITRERERLAKIFANEKTPKELVSAIMDNSYDASIFRWRGMGVSIDEPLDEPPTVKTPA